MLLAAVIVIGGLFFSGCQAFQPKPAALSDEQVGQVVENILQALNAGDYPTFTQDFGTAMNTAFIESEFNKLRDLLQNTSGKYVSKTDAKLLNNQGYAVYRFPCKFEKEDVTVTVTFKVGGDKVEGLFFDSTSLRKVKP
jgi:hypothetical protein